MLHAETLLSKLPVKKPKGFFKRQGVQPDNLTDTSP